MIHHFPEDFIYQEPFHGFTDPFRYAPHQSVSAAAQLVIRDIESDQSLSEAFSEGKMLGVLVCTVPSQSPTVIPTERHTVIPTERHTVIPTERSERRNLLYLAAFSGNVGGRSHIDGFVPPIFDLLDPSGHFKAHEAEITALNHKIHTLSHSDRLVSLEADLQAAEQAKELSLTDFRKQMSQSRIRREELRNATADPHILAGLIKESQFEKAEFKRLKKAWDKKIDDIKAQLQVLRDEIAELKASRASMSDQLQEWIFRQYVVHNALGESSSIADLFACKGLVPPGGTGECAAPKLLEYAYRNGLEPLAMGEFWYGRSPETAVRTHGHFYPSCTSKCGPLLGYMLEGIERGQRIPLIPSRIMQTPRIIYEDDAIVVAEKPSGMPSVPGLDGRLSLEEYLTSALYFSDESIDRTEGLDYVGVIAAHRLDMDTSGVMVLAKSPETLNNLRRQFEDHTVRKTYMARICGSLQSGRSDTGTITLPLSPDYDERPRQKVDLKQGKASHTDYEVVQMNQDGTAELLLHPHTGRTHQLRVHCAHTLGLGCPIVGDLLYGGWSVRQICALEDSIKGIRASRLHLHALSMTFRHPVSGEEMTFTSRDLCY